MGIILKNFFIHLEQLKNVSINEMNSLKGELQKRNKTIEREFLAIGAKGLKLISDNELQHNQFSYSDLPNFFVKLTKIKELKVEDIKFEGRLNKSIEGNKNFYTAKCDASIKGIIGSFGTLSTPLSTVIFVPDMFIFFFQRA